MTKTEYMEQLQKKLKKLPKEDYLKAIEYYEEYFAEAGEDNEAHAIEDLGSPQEAADNIIREFAIDNVQDDTRKKDVRKGLRGVWIVILAIFASPIALPLIITIAALLFSAIVVVFALLFAFSITGIALLLTSVLSLIGAISMLIRDLPAALICFGISLCSLGIGALMVYGSYWVLKRFLNGIIVAFGKKFAKGEKKDEA